VLFVLAMFTALLTSFYTFRAYFRTFWGEEKIPPEAGSHGHGGHHDGDGAGHAAAQGHGHAAPDPVHGESPQPAPGHAHESPPVMTIPLMILAVGAVFVGMLLGPTEWIAHFLAHTPSFRPPILPAFEPETPNWALMGVSSVIALAGIGLAYVV